MSTNDINEITLNINEIKIEESLMNNINEVNIEEESIINNGIDSADKFSNNEGGKTLSDLWQNYVYELSAIDRSVNPIGCSLLSQEKFIIFSIDFIKLFESCESSFNGQPIEIISHITTLFLECLSVSNYLEDKNIISENSITGQEWLSISGGKTISKKKSFDVQFNNVFTLDKKNDSNGNSPKRNNELAYNLDHINLHRNYFLSVVHSMSVLLKWERNRSTIIELFTTNFPILLIEVIRSAISKMEECIVCWSDLANIDIISDYNKSMDKCCNDAHFIVSLLVGLIQLCSYSLPHDYNEEIIELSSNILPSQPWSIYCCQYLGFDLLNSHDNFNIQLSQPLLLNVPKKSNTSEDGVASSDLYMGSELSARGIVTILLTLISKISKMFSTLQELSIVSASSKTSTLLSFNPNKINNIGNTRKKCFILQCEVTHCISKYFQNHPKNSLQNYFSSCDGSSILQKLMYKESSPNDLPDIPTSDTVSSLGITDKEIDIIFIRGINCLKLNNLILKSINSRDYAKEIHENNLKIMNCIGPYISWLIKINLEYNIHDDFSFGCSLYNYFNIKHSETDLYPWTTENMTPPLHIDNDNFINLSNVSITNKGKYYEKQRENIAKEKKESGYGGKNHENFFDKRKYYLLAILDDIDSKSFDNNVKSDKKQLFRGKYSHMCKELFAELLKSIALSSIIKLNPIELASSLESKALLRSIEGNIIAVILKQISICFHSIKKFSYENAAMQTFYIIFLINILRDFKDETIGILFEPFNHNRKSSVSSQIIFSILFSCPLFFRNGLTHNPNELIQAGVSKIVSLNSTDQISHYEVKWNKTSSQLNDIEVTIARPHLISNDSNNDDMDLAAFDLESLAEHGSISRHSSPPLEISRQSSPPLEISRQSSPPLEGDLYNLPISISRSTSSFFSNDPLDNINNPLQDIAASYFLLHDLSFDFLWIVFTILAKEGAEQKIISTIDSLLSLLTGETSDDVIMQVSVFLSKIWDYLLFNNIILPASCWINFIKQTGLICDVLSVNASKEITKTKRPFFTPAKIAVVQLMVKVMKSRIFDIKDIIQKDLKQWVDRLKHSKLILDKRCRKAALCIVTKLMASASNYYESLEKNPVTHHKGSDKVINSSPESHVKHEDLLHEILRYLVRIVKHSSDFDAVVDVLHNLSSFLRHSSCSIKARNCFFDRYYSSKSTKESHYQCDIISDIMASLKFSLQKDRSWSTQQKSILLRYAFTFFTSLMIDYDTYKEKFRQYLLQRVKLEGLASFSLTSKNCNYHDIASFISEVEGCPSFETILVFFEMLFDGLSSNFLNPRLLLANNDIPKDGLISSKSVVPVMVNLSCIPLLMTIVKYCDESVQLFILNTFQNLISGSNSVVNLSKCLNMQPSMIDLILDFFPFVSAAVQKNAVKLLQTIGKHSISVAELKRFFRLMQIKGEFRPSYTWMLLDALNGMIQNNSNINGPKYYFSLRGENSGLQLPAIQRWPATKGYSFSTWFNILSLPNISAKESIDGEFRQNRKSSSSGPHSEESRYNPILLSIRQDNGGAGIEISFRSDNREINEYTIIITVYITNSPPSYIEIPMPKRISTKDVSLTSDSFQRKSTNTNISNNIEKKTDIWHHIIIAHTPSTFRSKSEMSVLIDGNYSKHVLSFPRFKDKISEPIIGNKSNIFKSSTENVCFCGQLGPIYFFSEPLTELYMRGIHELGPGYSKLFSDRDGSNTREGKDGIEIKQQSKALNGTLTSLIMLAFNPGVWKGNFAVDVTPEKNQTRWRPPKATSDSNGKEREKDNMLLEEYETFGNHGNSYSHARCLTGTYRSTTKDMRDALDCLGGIKVLLPLFAQFDLPILNSDSKISSFDDNICLSIWKLIFSLLRDSAENHRLMDVMEGNKTKGNGFKTISYFLERISPNHLKLDVFYLLIDKTKELAEINLDWQDSFIKYILCNFKIWIFTSYLVQRDLMRFLIEFVQDNPKRGLEILPVQTIMNILHQWYNQTALDKMHEGKSSVILFDKNNDKDATNHPLPDRNTKDRRSVRMDKDKKIVITDDELMVIRSNFFQLIYMQLSTLVKNSSNIIDEIDIIIRQITNESRPKYMIECLQLLLRIINPEKEKLGVKVLYALGIKNCIHDILSLLSHSNGKLRLYAHIFLCSIIQFALHRGPLPAPTLRSPKKDSNNSQSQFISLSESTIPSESVSNESLYEDASRFTSASIRQTNSQFSSLISSPIKSTTKEVKDIFDTIGIPFATFGFFFAWIVNANITAMKSSFLFSETHDQQCQIIFKSLLLTMQGQVCKYLVNDIELIFNSNNDPNKDLNDEDQSEIPYLRQSSYEIKKEFIEKSKDLQICLPVLWTILIDFIENDIITTNRRLKFISILKSIFDGFSNFEAILSVPCWQECYIRLFVNEMRKIDIIQKKYKSLNSELLENKRQCQEIFDIAINMVCDLHYHCIEIGMSGISNMVSSPKDVVRIDLNTMNWNEFLNILKIRDIVGTQKLRETMTHIRCSGLQASHNISNQLCCLLLKQTITRIEQENDKLKNIEQDEEVKNVRIRMMSLNQWLVAMEVLEFLSFPPIQQSPSSQNDNVALNSPRLMRGISAPERYHEVVDSNGNRTRNSSAISMNTDDSDTGLDDTCIEENYDKAFLNLDIIERNRSFSFSNDSNKLSIPHVSSLKSASSSNSLNSSNSPQVMRNVSASDSISDDEFSKNSLHLSSGISDSVLFNDEAYCHELDKFNLIESIMKSIGPLENYSSVWDPSTNRMERIKMGMKVGFMFSRTVLNQVTESVDNLVNSSTTSSTTSTNKQGQGSTIMGGALSKCIDRVLWNLLRVLLTIFLSGGTSDNFNRIETEDSPHILACNRIMTLLDFLMNRARDYYDSESLYVTACVSLVLIKTDRPINSLWTKYAFKLISGLLVMRRDDVLTRLSEDQFGSNHNDSNHIRQSISVPFGHTSPLKEYQSESIISPKLLVEQTLLKEIVAELHCKIDTICHSTSESLPTSEVALAVIRLSLIGSSTDYSQIVSSLTLDAWKSFINPISDEGKKIENEILSSRLTDFGLHKPSHELSQTLDKQKALYKNYFNDMKVNIEKSINNSKCAEMNHFKFHNRSEESQRRRNAMNWNSILEELANERGPWGVGVDEVSDVFWMIDPAEDDLRNKRKTRRNPRGCRHESASLLTSSIFESCDISFNKQNEEQNEVKDVKKEEKDEFIKNDNYVNPELWRDLMKYQSKNSTNKDNSSQNSVDEFDNVEELDLNEESDEDFNEDGEQIQSINSPSLYDNSSNILSLSANSNSKVVNTIGITDIYEGDVPKSKVLYRSDCEIITLASNSLSLPSIGTLEVTKTKIIYTRCAEYTGMSKRATQMNQTVNRETSWAYVPFQTTHWDPIDVSNVLQRYYKLRFVGVEIFFINRQSVFINLYEVEKATLFLKVIRQKLKPINIKPNLGRIPSLIIQKANIPESLQPTLTLAWANREISNFEYLIKLNTYAGRTCNDLGQYPVFPWVLKDYTSEKLDLTNPETFRDLAWPIGAQNLKQREHVASSYEDLNDIYQEDERDNYSMPPFHFGSHYSVAGFVLWYLMRVEPYTSLHIQLQDGKFDKSDRLFNSIAAAYNGCTTNQSDVKELIPEMFYCPEILQNMNKIDLGKRQNGTQVNDVVLPPWANDAHDFIYQHREALESEYVSQNLHSWIDLIFGYKQRPPSMGGDQAAIDSCNVFFHLTYMDAFNLDELKKNDPVKYDQYICQISEFGQTPAQLFSKPHIKREPLHSVDIIWPIASVVRGNNTMFNGQPAPTKPEKILAFKFYEVSILPLIFIAECGDRLITVDISRIMGCHLWYTHLPDVVPPFKIKIDSAAYAMSKGIPESSRFSITPMFDNSSNSQRERRIGVPFAFPTISSVSVRNSSGHSSVTEVKDRFMKQWRRETCEDYESKFPKSKETFTSNSVKSSKKKNPSAPSTPNKIKPHKESTKSLAPTKSETAKSSHNNTYDTDKSDEYSHNAFDSAISDEHLSPSLFAVIPGSRLIFSCGYWDHSLRSNSIDTGKLVQAVYHHSDVVTSIAIGKDFNKYWLVTGSRDCTVHVWDIHLERQDPLGLNPLHILYGHDDAVTSVAINAELDMVISGSIDGTIIMHNLREGLYVRSIVVGNTLKQTSFKPNLETRSTSTSNADITSLLSPQTQHLKKVTWVGISKEGYIVVYVAEDDMLYSYTINGHLLVSRLMHERLNAFIISEDGLVLLTGGSSCLIVLWWVRTLEFADTDARSGLKCVVDGSVNEKDKGVPFSSPIRSIYMTKNERHLIVGLESGEMRILAQDSSYLRQRLQVKLKEIGIL